VTERPEELSSTSVPPLRFRPDDNASAAAANFLGVALRELLTLTLFKRIYNLKLVLRENVILAQLKWLLMIGIGGKAYYIFKRTIENNTHDLGFGLGLAFCFTDVELPPSISPEEPEKGK